MDSADYSIMNSTFKEEEWVLEINTILQKQDLEDYTDDVPETIFQVPKSLTSFKPECYIPQIVGLGPLHHLRPETYQREIDKLAAGKRAHNDFQLVQFEQLVAIIETQDHKIRKCYEKYFNYRSKTLGWMMVVDALFLLRLLHIYVPPQPGNNVPAPSFSSGSSSPANLPAVYDLVFRDILMLENQIPLLVLRDIAENGSQVSDRLNKYLPSMLLRFCQANSPIELDVSIWIALCPWEESDLDDGTTDEVSQLLPVEITEEKPSAAIMEHAHLLDIIYHQQVSGEPCSPFKTFFFKIQGPFMPESWEIAKKLDIGFIQAIKKPVDLVLNLLIKFGVTAKCFEEVLTDNTFVPTVSQLSKANVKFSTKHGGVRSVSFDKHNKTLYLPVMNLDLKSDVIIRNLVVYEAMAKPEVMIFTRFTELMNGLIDTAEDVELLKKDRIIKSKVESAELAEVFNGMSKSIDAKGKTDLETTIKDVNDYYNNIGRVKAVKLMKRYVYTSWKILTVLATILFLVLTCLQTFCSVYTCHHVFINDKLLVNKKTLAEGLLPVPLMIFKENQM